MRNQEDEIVVNDIIIIQLRVILPPILESEEESAATLIVYPRHRQIIGKILSSQWPMVRRFDIR